MKTKRSNILGEPTPDQLKFIVRMANSLNDAPGLRELIHEWLKAGRNLRVVLSNDPKLDNKFKTAKASIIATGEGAMLLVRPHGAGRGTQDALVLFQTLMLSPWLENFRGPCCRCKSFYYAQSKRKRVYCSQGCGAAKCAVVSTRKRRIQAHLVKIKKANGTIQRWTSTPSKRDWKRWVSSETGLTVQFLSRALNKGELKAPGMK